LHAVIVETFDAIKHGRSCSGLGQEALALAVDALALDHAEEALRRCMVGTVTHDAHAAKDVVVGQESLMVPHW